MFDRLKCFFGLHDWKYAGEPNSKLPSSERWYWHLEECRRCPVQAEALNGHCACEGVA